VQEQEQDRQGQQAPRLAQDWALRADSVPTCCPLSAHACKKGRVHNPLPGLHTTPRSRPGRSRRSPLLGALARLVRAQAVAEARAQAAAEVPALAVAEALVLSR